MLSPQAWPCGDCLCDENGYGEARYKIPGVLEPTHQCLRKMVTPFTWYLLDLHKHYMAGNLAVAGGVTDQPAIYLEAMATITEWIQHDEQSGDR